ncbi:MAG: hypothetical protein AAGA02_16525 [Bacteroidota bacterium]
MMVIFEHNNFSYIVKEKGSWHKCLPPLVFCIDKKVPERIYTAVKNNVFSNITFSQIDGLTLREVRFYHWENLNKQALYFEKRPNLENINLKNFR